jgi:hypothetical protein
MEDNSSQDETVLVATPERSTSSLTGMKTPSVRLSRHNRGALPTRRRRHFFYRAATPVLDQADIKAVGDAVMDIVVEYGIGVAEIQVFNCKQFAELASEAAVASFQRLIEGLGLDVAADRVSLLACEWASPHDDSSFCGSAFLSLVLRTGDSPYVMSMFHHRRMPDSRALDLITTTRVLKPADLVVFDPTIPHMAAPGRPNEKALLVLLQAEVDIEQPGALQALVQRFPRHPEDRNQQDVFDAILGSLE